MQELHGIGPATAENIIEYREEHGGFNYIEEIKEVSGIGPATFEDIEDDIVVVDDNIETEETKSYKLNINTADKTQLQELWGIGEVIAERIIEYRKENGLFESIEEIKVVDGVDEYKFNRWKDNITV